MEVNTETQDLVPDIMRFIVRMREELIFRNTCKPWKVADETLRQIPV